jgi:hypothetical protein
MSAPTPYFYNRTGAPSWNPSPSDTEVPSLQKINGLLAQIVANGGSGGGGGSGGTILAEGQATLVNGSVTVTNAAITAKSKPSFGITSPVNPGWIQATVSAGQVVFASTNNTDGSTINYILFA